MAHTPKVYVLLFLHELCILFFLQIDVCFKSQLYVALFAGRHQSIYGKQDKVPDYSSKIESRARTTVLRPRPLLSRAWNIEVKRYLEDLAAIRVCWHLVSHRPVLICHCHQPYIGHFPVALDHSLRLKERNIKILFHYNIGLVCCRLFLIYS